MKKVLITGGSGLIGHEVTKVLIERGFDVNVLDLGEVEVKNIVDEFYMSLPSGLVQ